MPALAATIMRIKFKKGFQSRVIATAIKQCGSEKRVVDLTRISKGALYRYKKEEAHISHERLITLLPLTGFVLSDISKNILSHLPENWGQKLGGKRAVEKKKDAGTFQESLNVLKQASSKRMTEWHREMKSKYPRDYHIWQYERFKKIGGGYKYKLKNNLPVRNRHEKQVGDFLINHQLLFEYEPLLRIGGKTFFPDFKIGNILLEVTAWSHPHTEKKRKLKEKIDAYNQAGFIPYLILPEKLGNFYKEINCALIFQTKKLKEILPR